MKILILFALGVFTALTVTAQNWDYIQQSGEYYYGQGCAETEAEADRAALAELVGMISTHVSSDFSMLTDETNTNGTIDHKSQVLQCVNTYAQGTLTNTEKFVLGREPEVTVRRFMKKSELARVYDNRIAKARDMIALADASMAKTKVDMALQYYYWAYSLLRSVQFPNEVKDSEKGILVNWLPTRIQEILSNISVKFEGRDGEFVDLLFYYDGKPLSSVEYTYSDGRANCHGAAKDGRGMIEMIPDYETDIYHLSIEYEYKDQARGDAEMQSVMDVITRKPFPKAVFAVRAKETSKPKTRQDRKELAILPGQADETGVSLKPSVTQEADNKSEYEVILNKVIDAIRSRNYSSAGKYFTVEGLEVYNKLVTYGTGRVVGTPHLTFFKSANGGVAVRGLQMSFSFKTAGKKTFVEDVVFFFDSSKKICNVAFGLGQVAENDILCKNAPNWKEDARELLMEFMENYKTAYCLKRHDYISDVFADDAVIIVGNVLRKASAADASSSYTVSDEGNELIRYNKYTKKTYLDHLRKVFARSEFINIRFSHNDVQPLTKFDKEELYAIQIGQEYNSSRYSDKGFLFLLIDMTDHEAPLIRIRTWQPNEVDMSKLYNIGDFYNE